MFKNKYLSSDCNLYEAGLKDIDNVNCYIASTKETRSISNDSMVMGVNYTRKLKKACEKIFIKLHKEGLISINEQESIVFNVLRGGLNFGLRDALANAFDWNLHGSSFISAQRARKDDSPEEWHIIETEYSKVYMPDNATIFIGDVVATGTSLEHAIEALINETEKQGSTLRSIIFFTYGGIRAAQILEKADKICKSKFPSYEKTVLIFHEGCFTVPDQNTKLSIKITGTDLVSLDSVMAPDFIESQYENPAFPLQRCAIYDAGSRAFWLPEYIKDIEEYWKEVYKLAKSGINFTTLLKERFPDLDPEKFNSPDLEKLSLNEVEKIKNISNK